MNQPLGQLARTHTCGALTRQDVGADVVLLGWVHRVRDLGSLVFLDVRDRHGITQVVVRDNDQLLADDQAGAAGVRRRRARAGRTAVARVGQPEGADRRDRGRGARAAPPQRGQDAAVPDCRRVRRCRGHAAEVPLSRSAPRAHAAATSRCGTARPWRSASTSTAQGFLEIETPMLTKSTPEGARDYLVPSRVHPGEFYALPQSPQIFKQILMIAGMDRYFQIVKCFRDEDLRADRQPEFTQVDLEISFATEDLVFATVEPCMERLMALIGTDAPRPFRRMPYAEAIAKYGSDKPDLRCGMEIARPVGGVRRHRLPAVPRRAGRRRRRPRVRRRRRGEVLAPRARRTRRAGAAVRRRRPGLGARGGSGGPEPGAQGGGGGGDPAGARHRRRGARRPAADGRGQARSDVADARLAAPAGREEGKPARPGEVRVPVGRRLPDVRVVRGRAALGVHAPSRSPRRSKATSACSRAIPARRARAPTTLS